MALNGKQITTVSCNQVGAESVTSMKGRRRHKELSICCRPFPMMDSYGLTGEPSRGDKWLYDLLYSSEYLRPPQEKIMEVGQHICGTFPDEPLQCSCNERHKTPAYMETPDSGKWSENLKELGGGLHIVFPFQFNRW